MSGARRIIHLINPLWDALGGSELRTLGLYDELKDRAEVNLWTRYQPDPRLDGRYAIRRIVPRRLEFPKTGTFIFVGAYVQVGRWVHLTAPRRIILVYNTPDAARLQRLMGTLSRRGTRAVELVYASELVRRTVGLGGVVHPSPIDLARFVPADGIRSGTVSHRFTVGRLSRDVPEKHHADDLRLYRRLAELGCRVRVMGGTCLAPQAGATDSVELLSVGAEEPEAFLRGLDCFFYRTAECLTESFGRVVLEAMACGLPVVCHARGGYAEVIETGRNGFLFENEREALEMLLRLKDDEPFRRAIGMAARETALELYSAQRRREFADFYLR
jgi:glycosyltransferase involved in cell wall biosynthesis